MAVKFLSEEWAQEMTDALNSSEDFRNAAAGKDLKLQQVVTDAPGDGERNYFLAIDDGRARVALGEIADADATMTQSYDTAAAIMRQQLNAQQAFMQGKVRVSGNLMKLFQLQGVFSEVTRAVRAVDIDYAH